MQFMPPSNFLPNTQNCVINNPTMVAQVINSGETGEVTLSSPFVF